MEFVNSENLQLFSTKATNFVSTKHKTLKNDVQRWPCSVKSCKCFLKLSPLNKIVDSNTNHNHNKNDEKILNRQILSNSLKRKAIEDISCKSSKLIRSELKKGDVSTLTTND